MDRIAKGWRLAQLGWSVLSEEPRLMVLPLVAALTQGLIAASYVLGIVGIQELNSSPTHVLVVMFPVYAICTLVDTFAVTALVTVVDGRLRGGQLTLGDGLRRAVGLLPNLIGWSLLSATVGTLLRLAEQRLPFFGRIAAAIAGVAWSLATIFAVPVLALEGRTPLDTVRRSGRIFRSTWGETLVADGAAGLAVGLAAIPLMLCAGALALVWVPVGVTALLIVVAGVMTLSSALNATVLTAAYRFAVHGELPASITDADLALAFRPSKRDD